MQDHLDIFWRNEGHARALFDDLKSRMARNACDEDFIAQLAAYREAGGNSVHADIFAARYLLAQGDAAGAVVCGERAFRLRPVNRAVWEILAEAYTRLGREFDAAVMYAYISHMYETQPFPVDLNSADTAEILGRISIALDHHNYAPQIKNRAHIENGTIAFGFDIFLFEHLSLTMPEGHPRFWVGTYVDEGVLPDLSIVCNKFRHEEFLMLFDRTITFDLQKAQETTAPVRVEVPAGTSVVLPVAGGGTQLKQEFHIDTASATHPGYLGPGAFNYFRLNDSAVLRSDGDTPFVVGTPIRIGHSPRRKKLVLNILVDGLCWPAVRPLFEEHMPRIAKFFSRGVIFDRHYSASEYTFASLPTIETGRDPRHTQLFNERCSHELPLDIRTLSEEMHDLGYYCAAPMASGCAFYHGMLRGYDRLVMSYCFLLAAEGAERTIRQIEAFNETDLFLFFHTTDVHPLNINKPMKFSEEVESGIDLADHFVDISSPTPSVRIPHLPIYLRQHEVSLRHIDRCIGQLLSYIEERYDENEYIVSLYSDHGCGMFDPNPPGGAIDFVGRYAVGASWMIRGAGVPRGVVADELTSTADIYPALGALCGFPVPTDLDGNLPAVLGGAERDVVCSVS
ncbi:sulfatase-like hydrolase/transferase [Selenomonas sp. F0473]|uniref:sulfatase-like hydrolase/transferase n=1 Tax=Selenomonas sp. F0473 TaxID=999423 RepID=UPI003459823B